MITTDSTPIGSAPTESSAARVLPFTKEFNSSTDHTFAATRRRRSVALITELCCDWTEAAILASLAWIGSFILTGLIHCASVHCALDPELLRSLHDDPGKAAGAGFQRTAAQEVRK
jgi:hypothetical protein